MPGLAQRRCGKVAIGKSIVHLSTACTAALFRHFRYSSCSRQPPERTSLDLSPSLVFENQLRAAMPRSNPQTVATEEMVVIWDKLDWWHRDYTGERDREYKRVTFRPLTLVEELDRREHLAGLDDRYRFNTFYSMEVEGQPWQSEFDELYGNYLEDEPRRIDALIKWFMSPFPNIPPPEGPENLRSPLTDAEGYSARGCFLMLCATGIGCCEELGQWRPSTEGDRLLKLFRRYLLRCFPDDTSTGSMGGRPGGFYGARTVHLSPDSVMRFKPFTES